MAARAHAPAAVTPDRAGCVVCSAPTGDDAGLCRTHTGALAHTLGDVPDLIADLIVTETRQDAVAPSAERPGSSDALGWNERAVQVSVDLSVTIAAWGTIISRHDENGWDRWAAITTAGDGAVWLSRNIGLVRRHPDVRDAYDELTDAVRRAWRVVDIPATRTRFAAGPCPETVPWVAVDPAAPTASGVTVVGVPCPGEVWAFIPATPDRAATLACRSCGASWSTKQWLRVGRRMLTRMRQIRDGRLPA